MIRIFGGCCDICGSRRRLEFAHVRPTGLDGMSRGSIKRIQDVESNPDAYRLMCRRDHLAYDFKNQSVEVAERQVYISPIAQ